MTGLVMVPLVLAGLVVAIGVLSRVLLLVFPHRLAQDRRFRAAAEALGARFRRSLVVADPELRLWLHGQPVFVTSSFGRHGVELSRVRLDDLEGCPWPGLYLDLAPGVIPQCERLGPDGLDAAGELAALVGGPCSLEIRQKLWGDRGFAELSCGGFLSDHPDGPDVLARAILLMQRVAYDPLLGRTSQQVGRSIGGDGG
jgi:hypothetical protein